MRYHRFDFEKNSPIFRPPKYTGITLSLLSVFVLVSMLAVWEKMANVPDLPVLNVLAWDKAQEPLERVRVAYQKEASCLVHISYLSHSALSSQLAGDTSKSSQTWDILLVPKTNDLEILLTKNRYQYRGLIAHLKDHSGHIKETEEAQYKEPLSGWVNQPKEIQVQALSFLRFLRAPTKGQVEFAINGWIGVSGDHWARSPQLNLYAIKETKDRLESYAQRFANEQGIDLQLSFLEEQRLLASLQILTKANHKDYLPDLLVLPVSASEQSWLLPFYSEFKNKSEISSEKYLFYLRKKSPLLKTIQKFLQNLSEDL